MLKVIAILMMMLSTLANAETDFFDEELLCKQQPTVSNVTYFNAAGVAVDPSTPIGPGGSIVFEGVFPPGNYNVSFLVTLTQNFEPIPGIVIPAGKQISEGLILRTPVNTTVFTATAFLSNTQVTGVYMSDGKLYQKINCTDVIFPFTLF